MTGRRKEMNRVALFHLGENIRHPGMGHSMGGDLKGKTRGQVIYSVLYSENKKPDGPVKRTDRGTFKLNAKGPKAQTERA
jgi:hypothetical protein